jgi:hypothetical protein
MTKSKIINGRLLMLALAFLVLIGFASRAQAATYTFASLTGDSQAGSLSVDVVAGGGDSVIFTFNNNVTVDGSTIVSIYWDWGSLAGSLGDPSGFGQSAGVSYLDNKGNWSSANPGDLPGGTNIGFTADFSLDPQNKGGKIHNGISQGETLSVTWVLSGGVTLSQLLTALDSGDARVGVHVQGVGENGNLSFSAVTHTPLPGAAWLLGTGLLGLVGVRLRRRG